MISKVREGLYIGDLPSAENVQLLKTQGITSILSLLSGPATSYTSLHETVTAQNLHTKHMDIDDAPSSSLVPHIAEIRSFLTNHTKPEYAVLVHCRSGISRSASAILLHEIGHGTPLTTALSALKAVHPIACPAPWFLAELHALSLTRAAFPPVLCRGTDPHCTALVLRAAAVGTIIPRPVCACDAVRCRKCRTGLFTACAAFGTTSRRTAIQIAETDVAIARRPTRGTPAKLLCGKCRAKIGHSRYAVWKMGQVAGIGHVPLAEITVSAVDCPIGFAWPDQQGFIV